MASNSEILNTKEAAAFIGLQPPTLYKAVSTKTGLTSDIPHLKLGRRTVYKKSDLLSWLERHKVCPDALEANQS